MLSWFEKGCAYVRWGNAISFVFTISAGVRQGGLLSPLLFDVYMDVLINRLRNTGIGCELAQIHKFTVFTSGGDFRIL